MLISFWDVAKSVKAQDFDSCSRAFESRHPSQTKKPSTQVGGFSFVFIHYSLRWPFRMNNKAFDFVKYEVARKLANE